MKNCRKISILLAAAVLVSALLSGCGLREAYQSRKMQELAGIWTMVIQDTEEEAKLLLESFEFYEEEIALVDLTNLYYVQTVEFTTEGTYRFGYGAEETLQFARSFYEGVFEDLFDHREALNDVYGMDFTSMDRNDFYLFYASDLYGYGSYEELLQDFIDLTYETGALDETLETGTYTVQGDYLMCTIIGETEAESLGYELDGDTLTLIYADLTEVYTRAGTADV